MNPATQLRLLPAPQPLIERLGPEFFRGIPRQPGVYRMFDDADRLVYVGKAKDLHARLASYRRTHGQARKTIRLIHAAWRIEWEICADDTSARLRENELIRTHRPRFNRAGTWPRSARFVALEERTGGFRLRVTGEPAGEAYGAFRAGATFGMASLARLLWFAWNRRTRVAELPRALVLGSALRDFESDHAEAPGWLPDIRRFLAEADEALLARLVESLPQPDAPFDGAFIAAQFETLLDFHRRGPLRNARLRERFLPTAAALAPEELDDLVVRAEPGERFPAFRPPS